MHHRFLLHCTILFLTLTLAGCIGKSTPVNQYTLEALPLAKETVYPSYSGQNIILIGPVQLPRQLTAPGIVTREEPMLISTSATNFWAAPLEEQMVTVLSRQLAALLQTNKITPYPGPRFASATYQLELAIEQFSGTLNENFTCSLHWTLNNLHTRKIIRREYCTITVPVIGNSYHGYAAAASAALARLSSTKIATAIAELRQKQVQLQAVPAK